MNLASELKHEFRQVFILAKGLLYFSFNGIDGFGLARNYCERHQKISR
jgi:hypothetical protein